jgi:hypothetical protein
MCLLVVLAPLCMCPQYQCISAAPAVAARPAYARGGRTNQRGGSAQQTSGTCMHTLHTSAYVSIRQQHTRNQRGGSSQQTPGTCTPAHVSIRSTRQHTQHTSAYVSIRQHTTAYVSIRSTHTPAYVSIRQHTSAYVSIRQHTSQHTSAYVSMRQHTTAYASIRSTHTPADVSIRQHTQHTSEYVRWQRSPQESYIVTGSAARDSARTIFSPRQAASGTACSYRSPCSNERQNT